MAKDIITLIHCVEARKILVSLSKYDNVILKRSPSRKEKE